MPETAEVETNPQQESPTRLSFRERARERLQAERTQAEPVAPPPGYEEEAGEANPVEAEAESDDKVGEGYEEALDPARQAEEEPGTEEPVAETEPTEEAAAEDAVTETSDPDPDAEPEYGSVEFERQRADEAEEARRNMERDYRVKTHKIAGAVRNIEQLGSEVQEQARFYAELSEQGVRQFDNVNWEVLKTQPEEYQRTRAAFQQAVSFRDQLKQRFEQISQGNRQRLEDARKHEASVSQDILQATVPGWSDELYGKLRAFAIEELSYTAEEYDDIGDWRRIRDIHAQYAVAQAPRRVTKLQRKKGKAPAKRQVNKPTGQPPRNAQGQFQSARQDFWNKPGDPRARRSFFQNKLAAERGRR